MVFAAGGVVAEVSLVGGAGVAAVADAVLVLAFSEGAGAGAFVEEEAVAFFA